MIFGNKSIVSNRIESLSSEFKQIIPNREMQNENHIASRIKQLVQLKNALSLGVKSKIGILVSARLRFYNMLAFFARNITNIELRKEEVMN